MRIFTALYVIATIVAFILTLGYSIKTDGVRIQSQIQTYCTDHGFTNVTTCPVRRLTLEDK